MIVSLENEKMELSLNLKTQERSVKVGDVVDGVITGISNNGCFVSLDYMHTGRIKISNISDSYVKEWKSLVTMGKVVKTVVVEIKGTKIECSLKDSDVDPTKRKKTINEFEKGMVVTGSVKRVESFGVFVQIDGSDVVGLCHISQVSDSGVKDLDGFEKGDVVKAFILKVDKEKKKVSLSLQASKVDVTDDMDVEEASVSGEGIEESEPDSQGDSDGEDQVDQDDVEMQKDDEESEKEEEPVKVQVKQPLMLEGFSWDSSDLVNTTPDSDSDSEEEVKKSRRAVKKEKSDKEKMIQEREMQLLDDTRGPEMPEDFERLLLGSPNNSFLWIKYMAFQLELSETDKARQIAERALTIINFREEQERLNILVAYLNLENKFGNEESLEKLFDRACGMADPKKVHIQMVRIFERNDQTNVLLVNDRKLKLYTRKCARNSTCPARFGLDLRYLH
jgi:rRNA biogenesis protein RRP5